MEITTIIIVILIVALGALGYAFFRALEKIAIISDLHHLNPELSSFSRGISYLARFSYPPKGKASEILFTTMVNAGKKYLQHSILCWNDLDRFLALIKPYADRLDKQNTHVLTVWIGLLFQDTSHIEELLEKEKSISIQSHESAYMAGAYAFFRVHPAEWEKLHKIHSLDLMLQKWYRNLHALASEALEGTSITRIEMCIDLIENIPTRFQEEGMLALLERKLNSLTEEVNEELEKVKVKFA